MKSNKGYSLIVLVIAVVVILIITATAIVSINVTKEDKAINDFIYDINNIEMAVRQYYSSTGAIPILNESINVSSIGSQLDLNDSETRYMIDPNDNESYYKLDLTKLNLNEINNKDKTFIVNEGSLRVYMVEGITYRGNTYYTTTDELMGINSNYETQNMVDIVCTVSPTTWTKEANIRVIVPETVNDSWDFEYIIGPKNLEFFQHPENDPENAEKIHQFNYGDVITVKTNGVYSIYIQDASGNEIVKNVVVKNIDDIYPKYVIDNKGTAAVDDDEITIMDNETGIKEVRYKLKTEFESNKHEYNEQGTPGKDLDYYLFGGKGSLLSNLKDDIANYKTQLAKITSARAAMQTELDALESNFNALSAEEQDAQRAEYSSRVGEYAGNMQGLTTQEEDLNSAYAYILNGNTRYVLYVEDEVGNAIAIDKDMLTFDKICETFNITPPNYGG